MKLFFTDEEFRIDGLPRPGIPFLCDRSMELVAEPNWYLRHIASVSGRTRAPATWRTYGDHLLEFFAFLEDNGLAWTDLTFQELASWRDAMLERGCRRSTVNQRLRGVHAFYAWAKRQDLTNEIPFTTKEVLVTRPTQFLAHASSGGNQVQANELALRTIPAELQFLRLDKAVEFLEALTPARVRLMGYTMLLTGMRRQEVVALDYRVLPDPAGHDPGKSLPMVLDGQKTPTKGSRPRTVMVPYDLAVALADYCIFERHKLQRQFARRHARETTRLFLSERGEELSAKSLNDAFSAARRRTGILGRPHVLRHTFGTYELLRMRRERGDSQALLWVRDRLGHRSVTTTERYIHAADLIQHDAVDGYQRDLCEALRHGHPSIAA